MLATTSASASAFTQGVRRMRATARALVRPPARTTRGLRGRAQQLDERFSWKGAGSAPKAASEPADSKVVDLEAFTWNPGKTDGNLAEVWEAPGMYVEAPEGSGVEWFFLDVGRKDSPQPPMLLLHGMPSYSYVWRGVLPGLAAAGRRAIAVDLPGWGNSTMLQVGAGFDYTLEEYVDALDSLVTRLELRGEPLELVAPGLLGGTVGAMWAARHPEAVAKLTLVNVPLGADASELPKCLKPLTNPFTASIFCQNPLNVVGKPIEESGPYALDPNDQAAYLQPMLMDGNAGFIAMAVAKQLKTRGAASMAAALSGLASAAVSCEVIWGASDAWFGESPDAAAVAAINASVVKVPGAGHFAPEDWAEKVTKALLGQKVE